METHIEKIALDIEGKIVSGQWGEGQRLPRVHDMQTTFAASGPTVRSAMERLIGKGLIKKDGNSWFVTRGAENE